MNFAQEAQAQEIACFVPVNIVKAAPHWPLVLIAIPYASHLMVHI